MCTAAVPASAEGTLEMVASLLGSLAGLDPAQLPTGTLGRCLRAAERAEAVLTAVQAGLLGEFDVNDGHQADGQRTLGAWLVHVLRVTRRQAREYKAVQGLARDHAPLLAGLREADVITKSVALQLAAWTRDIPAEFRPEAEEILVAAARAGAGLRALAEICAEIRSRTAPPDPDRNDPALYRALFLDTTLDGAGVIRGDLTPECAAMVQAGTRPQRYHDALAEVMP